MTEETRSSKPTPALPDHLVLRLMTEQDQYEVAKLFASTFKREPMCAYLCRGVEDELSMGIAKGAIRDPVSHVVEDNTLPETENMVGFLAAYLLTLSQIQALKQKRELVGEPEDDVQGILNHMIDIWVDKTTLFKEKPEAKVLVIDAAGVDDRYGGYGLGQMLLSASMSKAREVRCDAVITIATAFASQHVFKNNWHFEPMAQVRYADWTRVDGNSRRPFENLHKPEFLVLFEKKVDVNDLRARL
ncbi:hypothetical protein EC991_005057 [Linnemannia zychae]|nr:hypothetical protein EC991_005057 [Linnemannia zychae]